MMGRAALRRASLLSVALAGAALSACAPAATPVTTTQSVVLRLGTDDHPGVPAASQIEEYASRVSALSDGAIVIEPVWHAAGDVADWDQAVAQLVMDGELELALVPTRAWDVFGIQSLRPLNTPFLIDSDELVHQILGSDLAGGMMAGLKASGVSGLALWPEGVRHPFGFSAPLVTAADFRGAQIRAATSQTVTETFAALGAGTDDAEPRADLHAGTESSFLLVPGGTATANITFYPKVAVLVANTAALESLTTEQARILREAADATRDWSATALPDELSAAAAFCDSGGSIVHAEAEEVVAMEAATAAVRADIADDPGGADALARIEELKRALPAAPVAPPCGNG